MKKVVIIGAGIFGASIALELSKKFDVTLFERSNGFLNGASTNNHLRHHHGYHYPRSKKTALESIQGRENFEKNYGDCVLDPISAYYAVSKFNSKTSPEDFLTFCNELNLPYTLEFPPKDCLNRSEVELCIRVPEPAYDPDILRVLVTDKISRSNVRVKFEHEIIGGHIAGGRKKLSIKSAKGIKDEEFDFVVSSIYSNFNNLNKWFGFPKKKVEYALVELLDIKIPIKERLALTIIDGVFSTFVPLHEEGVVRLGHVKESILKEITSDDLDTELIASKNSISNKERILEISAKYYPILKRAEFLRSIFVTRVVKANVDDTDERPTEITNHGSGIYSVFGGKVITCVDTAKSLLDILSRSD